jgi:hypothetical protein
MKPPNSYMRGFGYSDCKKFTLTTVWVYIKIIIIWKRTKDWWKPTVYNNRSERNDIFLWPKASEANTERDIQFSVPQSYMIFHGSIYVTKEIGRQFIRIEVDFSAYHKEDITDCFGFGRKPWQPNQTDCPNGNWQPMVTKQPLILTNENLQIGNWVL